MKRLRPLPLFRSTEPDVYLIDTSAWLKIDSHPDSEDLWRTIIALIGQGRIVACSQVLRELHNDPIYLLRLKQYDDALQAGDQRGDDPEYLQHVGKITHDHPSMSKATSWKTPADPYVVALAELDGYVVVADETTTVRPNRKIPGVCQKRKIRCITLDQFLEREGRGR